MRSTCSGNRVNHRAKVKIIEFQKFIFFVYINVLLIRFYLLWLFDTISKVRFFLQSYQGNLYIVLPACIRQSAVDTILCADLWSQSPLIINPMKPPHLLYTTAFGKSLHNLLCIMDIVIATACKIISSWSRHQMDIFSALLTLFEENHQSPVDSRHKGQWCRALMFSLVCTRTNGWANNRAPMVWDATALIVTLL